MQPPSGARATQLSKRAQRRGNRRERLQRRDDYVGLAVARAEIRASHPTVKGRRAQYKLARIVTQVANSQRVKDLESAASCPSAELAPAREHGPAKTTTPLSASAAEPAAREGARAELPQPAAGAAKSSGARRASQEGGEQPDQEPRAERIKEEPLGGTSPTIPTLPPSTPSAGSIRCKAEQAASPPRGEAAPTPRARVVATGAKQEAQEGAHLPLHAARRAPARRAELPQTRGRQRAALGRSHGDRWGRAQRLEDEQPHTRWLEGKAIFPNPEDIHIDAPPTPPWHAPRQQPQSKAARKEQQKGADHREQQRMEEGQANVKCEPTSDSEEHEALRRRSPTPAASAWASGARRESPVAAAAASRPRHSTGKPQHSRAWQAILDLHPAARGFQLRELQRAQKARQTQRRAWRAW